jgi:hypothetical protein
MASLLFGVSPGEPALLVAVFDPGRVRDRRGELDSGRARIAYRSARGVVLVIPR